MLRIVGKVYTGLVSPETTDALLVGDDGKIVATGKAALCATGGLPASAPCRPIEEISLGTRVACPGFIDAHVHLEGLARQLTQLRLDDARSLEDVLERVRERAKTTPREGVLFGLAWDESGWPRPEIPTRRTLDRAAPKHAVVLRRVCGHLWSVNSETLRRVAARGDLTGAERERLEAVSADGVLREHDIALAEPLARLSPAELAEGLLKAARHALALGATCVHDVGDVFETVSELDRRGELPLRVVAGCPAAPGRVDVPAWMFEPPRGLRVFPGPLKLFLDGAIGAQTAAVSEPFADDPGNTGVLLWDTETLVNAIEPFHARGVQLALHAIGDRAIRQALDVLERLLDRHPRPDPRHRIEHLEIIPDELVGRMSRLGVIASMQPNFVGRWQGPGGLYERRLGRRAVTLNPLRKILDAGIPLAFGSDCMPFGPLYGIRSAMHHTTPAERLTFAEALRAYTSSAAFAGRIGHVTGSIEPGKQADLVILSADPARGDDASVEEVFLAGRRGKPET